MILRAFLPFTALLIAVNYGAAQTIIPVYSSRADSTELAALQERIVTLMRPEVAGDPKLIDSLRGKLMTLHERALIGYRYQYDANSSFTALADLLSGNVSPSEVIRLSVSQYGKKRIPAELFKCQNLQQIEFVDARIKKIPSRLRRLKQLSHLAIYNHQVSIRFGRNSTMHHLSIRGENPNLLPRSFARLRKLDTLDLKRNKLERFPGIAKNRSLTQLILADNKITLRGRLPYNKSLQHLVLQRNNVAYVPASLAQFPALRKLVLNYNAITGMSPDLQSLVHLEELGLYHNQLTHIPRPVYGLQNLRCLDLYFNQIEKVPDSIAALKNLEVLYLSSNRLYSISEHIGELRELKELYVHHNRLNHLPSSIRNLSHLEVLRMNANNLVEVPDWLGGLSNLKNLDVSQNRIYRAPSVVKQLSKLELIGLTENAWENREQVEELAETLSARGVIVHLEQSE